MSTPNPCSGAQYSALFGRGTTLTPGQPGAVASIVSNPPVEQELLQCSARFLSGNEMCGFICRVPPGELSPARRSGSALARAPRSPSGS